MTEAAGGSLPLTTQLGSYQIVRPLASGGMADIYLARQSGLDRYVAVKVLNAQRAGDRESCALFLDEARVVGMLSHNNLASVYEVDRQNGVHYLAMEYVHGADLREVLARAEASNTAIDYDCALTLVTLAAKGLDHAHRRCDPEGRPLHLVHRDVSLSNIMVGYDGDLNISTSASRSPPRRSTPRRPASSAARRATCRPSSASATRSTCAPTCSHSASCCTS